MKPFCNLYIEFDVTRISLQIAATTDYAVSDGGPPFSSKKRACFSLLFSSAGNTFTVPRLARGVKNIVYPTALEQYL